MTGRKPFDVNVHFVKGKMCLILQHPESGRSERTESYIKNLIDFINSIDKLDMPEDCKERLILKSPVMMWFDEYSHNVSTASGIDSDIRGLYNGGKLVYISPLEYYYTSHFLLSSISNLINYIKNVNWLFADEVCKNEINMSKINDLRKDLDVKMTNIFDYEIDMLDKNRTDDFFEILRENDEIGEDFIEIFRLKVIADIINEDKVIEFYKNDTDNFKYSFQIHKDIIKVMHRMSEKYVLEVLDDETLNSEDDEEWLSLRERCSFQISKKCRLDRIKEFYELMNSGEKLVSLKGVVYNKDKWSSAGDDSYLEFVINDKYTAIINSMLRK
jgi:hypothetical protein